jgi:hypothetical protein
MAGLNQYAGPGGYIARPRFSGFAPIYTGLSPLNNPTTHYSIEDAIAIINSEINAGLVPPPIQYAYNGETITDDVIYMVLVPQSHVITSGSCYLADGCNAQVQDDNNRSYMAVVLGNYPEQLGHEFSEAITHWQGVQITNNCLDSPGLQQIADYCTCFTAGTGTGTLDGAQTVQSYYSAADGACIIPESWGPLQYHTQPGEGWLDSHVNFPQYSGGAGGVVAADEGYGVWFFRASSGTWTSMGPTVDPSELAAAGARAALLPMDTAQQVQYAVTGSTSWYELPFLPSVECASGVACPSPTPITRLVMTSAYGGSWAATDPTGEVWGWTGTSWANLNLRCDDLTAYNGDLLCSTGTLRHLIYDYPASHFQNGGGWTLFQNVTYPIVQLVSSPDDTLGQYGWIQGGEQILYDNLGNIYNGSEFASFSETDSPYKGGIQQQSSLIEWWLNSSNQRSGWGESGPVGCLVSGAAVYSTYCSGLTSTCSYF